VGKIYKIKTRLLPKTNIFIDMGRPKKEENDKKIKIGITINRELYNLIKKDNLKPSRIIEILVRDYYGNKNL
jgi:hypothetical protein